MFTISFTFFVLLGLGTAEELNKTFTGIRSIDIETTSGDCIIKAGTTNEVVVHMVSEVEPEGAFRPEVRQSGDRLNIEEEWRGSSSGRVVWTITIPKDLTIDFSTASGDLNVNIPKADLDAKTASGDVTVENAAGKIEIKTASGEVSLRDVSGQEIEIKTASGEVSLKSVNGDIQVSTASGDVDGSNVEGNLEMSTASGEIDLKDVKGALEFSCASGDITLSDVVLDQAASFSTASGDVKVYLAESAVHDIEMSAASGDVSLDYNGNDITGYFEFTARKRSGNISAPFDFDRVEEFEKHGQTYEQKSFTRGKDSPRIYLSTSSGSAILRK
jgi:DUF4097 and DUF4098 domain-containing protein YvlB